MPLGEVAKVQLSRALDAHIDERVVKHVAQLLTSNNARDLDKGIKLISRNKTLLRSKTRMQQPAPSGRAALRQE